MLLSLKKIRVHKTNPKKIPENPGIYIFWNKEKKPIYIGKSLNLKSRVASYFLQNLSPKTARMISEANYLSIIKVSSELEALLLEAKLVKDLQPQYNSQLKDDKNPLYIKITNDLFPQVITARKVDLTNSLTFFGPFPASGSVRGVLKMLRRIIPYAQHKIGKRGCLYSQIGLCNPCPSLTENMKDEKIKKNYRRLYKKNIKTIIKILSGDIHLVRESLEKEMVGFSREENFEKAKIVRDQIQKLDYITQPITPINEFLKNPNFIEDIRAAEINSLEAILAKYIRFSKKIERIECYDIAHLSGSKPTASLVTFVNAEPDKNYYRRFRIHPPAGEAGKKRGMDDLASLREVAQRRRKYFNPPPDGWGVPDLIIVDGGKTQVKTFWEELKNFGIPVIGLAKRFETLVIPQPQKDGLKYAQIRLPRIPARNLLQRIRDEAHRFARRYHFKLLQKELIPTS